MKQIPLAYDLLKEKLTAITILNKFIKEWFIQCVGDTDIFNITTRVLQGLLFLVIIYLDYVLETSNNLMKENGFTLIKKSKQ